MSNLSLVNTGLYGHCPLVLSCLAEAEEGPCKENSCDAKEDKAEKGLPLRSRRRPTPFSFREMGSSNAAGLSAVRGLPNMTSA